MQASTLSLVPIRRIFLLLALTLIFTSHPSFADPVEEEWEAAVPEPDDPNVSWLDGSHGYLTSRTQTLANWMDSYFGDSNYDSEQAESIIRVELENDWNSDDGSSFGAKVRGRVHLPSVSKRLSLVFRGDEEEEGSFDELLPAQKDDDRIGIQFSGRETKRSRFDYTLGWSSGHLRPGIKYRRQGPLGEKTTYRFTERIQYEHGKNIFSRTDFRLSRSLTNDSIVNWSSRLTYGERTRGVEWRTQLSWLNRYRVEHERPIAVSYFASTSGVTRPDSFASIYRAGLVYRRQLFKEYLFMEFEPSANYRKLAADENRELSWRAVLRLEIAISKEPDKVI